jgi:hypothetical protein
MLELLSKGPAERLIWMKKLSVGVWGTTHWSLDLIGKGAARFFSIKTFSNENDTYSVIGGAVVGAIFGALLGFALSDESRAMTIPVGTVIGGLVGVCTGMMFGGIVLTVDDVIDEWLNRMNSK